MKVTHGGVPVDSLISVVKDSIKQAGVSQMSPGRDLQVASVRLILEVVASKMAGGGLDFCVPFIGMKLSLGAKVTKKDTHTIDITLVPPEHRDTRQVRSGDIQEVRQQHRYLLRYHASRDNNTWRQRRTGRRAHPYTAPQTGAFQRMRRP